MTTKEKGKKNNFFIKSLNENNIKNHITKLIEEANNKNYTDKTSFITASSEERINNFEENLHIKNFPKYSLNEEKSNEVIGKLISIMGEQGISFNPKNYFAHQLLGTHTLPGLIGQLAGIFMNGNNVTKEVSIISNALEKQTGGMIKEMLYGCNKNSTIYKESAAFITSGGTEANHLALFVGRNWTYKQTEKYDFKEEGYAGLIEKNIFKKPIMIVPASKHYSLEKIANDLGYGRKGIKQVKVDKNQRMDIEDLEKTLNEIDTNKEKLTSIVTVYGTTESGSVDNIKEVYEKVTKFERDRNVFVWKHIDAAYGGPLVLTDKFEKDKETFRLFDSITFDPHKLLWTPYNAGSLLINNAHTLSAISTDAPYLGNNNLDKITKKEFIKALYEHTGAIKQIGSQATGGVIATYLTLKILGKEGIKQNLETTMKNTQYLSEELQKINPEKGEIEIYNKNPDSNVLNFRYKLPLESEETNNKINKQIFEHYKTEKEKHLISTTDLKIKDKKETIQRVVLINPLTTKKDIDEFVKSYSKCINQKTYRGE